MMAEPIESPNNVPSATDDLHTDATEPVQKTQRLFHRFQDLPQEVRDLVWNAAARSAYEPYNAMTEEDPRLFCMISRFKFTLEPVGIDARLDFKVAEEMLIKGLMALLLASKESNKQTKRAILGCQSNDESLPLLALLGYSFRGNQIRQLVMSQNDIMCLCHCYSWFWTSNSGADKYAVLAFQHLHHILLPISQTTRIGARHMGSLLQLTPHLRILYVDVSMIVSRHLRRRVPFSACELHGIEFKGKVARLCDLPPHLPKKGGEEGVGNQGETNDDEAVDGVSSAKESAQEEDGEEDGERDIDYRRLLDLLRPDHLRAFLEVWALCTEAGVKLQFVARRGLAEELFRHERS